MQWLTEQGKGQYRDPQKYQVTKKNIFDRDIVTFCIIALRVFTHSKL
jgi:hypothetical protein